MIKKHRLPPTNNIYAHHTTQGALAKKDPLSSTANLQGQDSSLKPGLAFHNNNNTRKNDFLQL